MMGETVVGSELSARRPARVALRCGDRWVRVPEWWAAAAYYRHGQTVARDDEAGARMAAALANVTRRFTKTLT